MELHFCSQCGISIPLAEVQTGAAGGADGRYLCSEHRAGGRGATAVAEAPKPGDVELLFCANCQVSVPVGDVDSGRAKKEFGSLFCVACSVADHAERERRRKAVETAMAEDVALPSVSETPTGRRCGVCSTPVPQSQIADGRARVEGNRVICPRCREAGASLPATAGSGAGTWLLVGLLVVACGAAGFFGAEYFKSRRTPPGPSAGAVEMAALRAEMDSRIAALATALEEREQEQRDSRKEAIDLVQNRFSEEVLAVREDLAEVRNRLSSSDNDLAQRIAKLEGHIGVLQEMLKGLAARPLPESPRALPPESMRPPEGPPAETPAVPAPGPGPGAQVDPDVSRMVKDLLESKEEGTRFAAATELTRRKERAAIPAFARQLAEDPNLIVRRACARGLGEVKAWYAVPVLIQALDDKEAYVAQQANYALLAITAQDFGVTIDSSTRDRKSRASAAAKWWDKNKDAPPDGVCLDRLQ
jgi:HEAT repeat protein